MTQGSENETPSTLNRIQVLSERFSWLLFLAVVMLLYALGGGLARYLGGVIEVSVYWLGQLVVVSLYLGVLLLDRYFDLQVSVENMGREVLGFLSYRSALLLGGAFFSTLAAVSSVLLIRFGSLTTAAFIMLVSGVVLGFLYAVPPFRLSDSGFGELAVAILLTNITPAFAFNLQFGEFHRLLTMTTAPLTLLALAMFIVYNLPEYAAQIKYEKNSLVTRLGWENAMFIHNLLILAAFLLLGLAAVFDLPAFSLYPALLPLPLGIFQIWGMQRIAHGAAPNWPLMKVSAAGLFVLMTYVLTFAFWTR